MAKRAHACAAVESLPDGTSVFLGFFAVQAVDPHARIHLPGRWLDVVSPNEGEAVLHARLLDMDLEWSLEIRRGLMRLWLPTSVEAIEFRTMASNRRIACSELGVLLML